MDHTSLSAGNDPSGGRPVRRIIDLSVTVDEDPATEPWPPTIQRESHAETARRRAPELGIRPEDFPGGLHLAVERLHILTHVGTHMDAPYHYGPQVGGEPAPFIEQVPLEWCIGPGVVLDVRRRDVADDVGVADLERACDAIGYRPQALDIVLLHTGASALLGQPGYTEAHPGLTREGVFWLLDRGVRVIGTDGYGLDKPFDRMAEQFRERGLPALFPAHYAGRERAYCQIEKLCNLDRIPVSRGFTVIALPVKLARCGAGWVRAVAVLEG